MSRPPGSLGPVPFLYLLSPFLSFMLLIQSFPSLPPSLPSIFPCRFFIHSFLSCKLPFSSNLLRVLYFLVTLSSFTLYVEILRQGTHVTSATEFHIQLCRRLALPVLLRGRISAVPRKENWFVILSQSYFYIVDIFVMGE